MSSQLMRRQPELNRVVRGWMRYQTQVVGMASDAREAPQPTAPQPLAMLTDVGDAGVEHLAGRDAGELVERVRGAPSSCP